MFNFRYIVSKPLGWKIVEFQDIFDLGVEVYLLSSCDHVPGSQPFQRIIRSDRNNHIHHPHID